MKTKESYTEPLVIKHTELRDITAQSGSMKRPEKTIDKALKEFEKIKEIEKLPEGGV